MGQEFLKEVLEVASGKIIKAEPLGYTEMAIPRLCNYVIGDCKIPILLSY